VTAVSPTGSPILLSSLGEDGVLELTLHRPEKRNALNGELVDALLEALHLAADNAAVRVVLLTGSGSDFCSGADLAELEAMAELGPEASLAQARRLGALFQALRDLPKPVVAAVRGRALAGGAGLAVASDLVVADEGAAFGFPEVHLGFVAAMVMTPLRRKVSEGRAFELVTRGDRISAPEAERIGLIQRVLPSEGFDAAAREWAAELASRPSEAVALSKRLLYGIETASFEQGIARGAEVNALARLTASCRTRVRAFLDRAGSRGEAP
jgi:methylglutaconyl-CoA hydratase